VAITFKKSGNDSILEFVLTYDNSAKAKLNIKALRTRVTEGHSAAMSKSLMGLNGLWTVQEVEAEGRFLRASVKVNEVNGKLVTSIIRLLWMPDFYFLYPKPE
jgi:hypothetical protein